MKSNDTGVLRLIATSDLHAELRDFDYARRRPDPMKGLSRAAGVIARLRAEVPCSVLCDGGDFLHGRPFATLPDYGVTDVLRAMEALDYDAVTLGNHDFDGGLDLLERALSGSSLPVVTGNITQIPSGGGYRPPFKLVQRTVVINGAALPLTIGLTGLLPPQTLTGAEYMAWDRLAVHPVAQVARDLVRQMRAAGADVVIALCHDGPETGIELADVGFDGIIMGHMHELFPGPDWPRHGALDPDAGRVAGVPAVMPGAWGRAVGTIDLSVTHTGGVWRVASSKVQVHKLSSERPLPPAAPAVLRASRSIHAAALLDAQRTVADLRAPLHTYFSGLGRCGVSRLVAAAAAHAVRETIGADALGGRPVVGLAAPVMSGGFGGPRNFVDIPHGKVTSGDLRDMVPHGDPIWGIAATANDLALWLERSVSALHHVIPGQIVPELMDSAFPSAAFDLPDCATFDLDLQALPAFTATGARTRHPAARVRNLAIDGKRVAPDMPIILAVTEHRIRGGGGFPVPQGACLAKTRQPGDIALRSYLEGKQPVPAPHVFNFLPIRHAIAIHRIGRGARGYPQEAEVLGLTRTRRSPDGWDIYRLPLGDGVLGGGALGGGVLGGGLLGGGLLGGCVLDEPRQSGRVCSGE